MSQKLKLKRVGQALTILTEDGSSIMPLVTQKDNEKCIDTLCEMIYRVSHRNSELQKSVMDDTLVESFATDETEALTEAVCMNIPSHLERDIEKALSFAPRHLQTQLLKQLAILTSKVFSDASEQVLLANDNMLLSKSLAAKSRTIVKDVDLLSEKLDESLEQIKRMNFEKSVKKELLRKGAEQGALAARSKYGTINQETLETAAAINKAKKVVADKADRLSDAISSARKASI